MEETAEPVVSAHCALPVLAHDRRIGGWIRRLQLKRPVRAMGVVVVDIDEKDLFQVASPDDQEPVEALGAGGADRGCRDVHAEPLQLALDAPVAPAWGVSRPGGRSTTGRPRPVQAALGGVGRSTRERRAGGASAGASWASRRSTASGSGAVPG